MTENPTPPKTSKNNIWLWLLKPKGALGQLFIFLLVGGLVYASHTGHLNTLRTFLSTERFAFVIDEYEISTYLVLKGILIAISLFWGTAIISNFGEKRIGKLHQIRSSTRVLLTKIFQIAVYVIAFLIGLDMMGIQLTALAVFGGALGIGIGFGLQKITSNFISGMILLMERTINQDDLVELTGGFYGFVRRINARFTLIETFDGKEIMVPNEDFITSQVINWTYSNKSGRVDITFGVSYDSDLDKAYALALEAACENERCMTDPAPVCYLTGFGDSSVDFLLYFWVSDVTAGRYGPRSEVLFGIWRKFKEAGIEIPFPQRDLHIRSADGLPQPEPTQPASKG